MGKRGCAHCGRKASVVYYLDGIKVSLKKTRPDSVAIKCSICGIQTAPQATLDEALRWWNMRHNQEFEILEEVKELAKEITYMCSHN